MGNTYDIADQELIGLADSPPEFVARFTLDFSGTSVTLRRPVYYRYVDPTEGELTRAVVVVPAVAVDLPESVALFPSEAAKKIEVRVKANTANMAGDLRLELPEGWKTAPASQDFRLVQTGDERTLTFAMTPPREDAHGLLRAVAKVDGIEISSGETVITFPHIPPQTLFPDATAKLDARRSS